MAARVTRARKRVVLSRRLHPHYAGTVAHHLSSMAATPGMSPDGPTRSGGLIDSSLACVVAEPGLLSAISETSPHSPTPSHAKGALLIAVVTEIVSLGAVAPPGAMGADIVVGEGQSIGNAPEFRRSLCGHLSQRARNSCARCRGRLAGETVDADGRRGFVLTLSTREQHILLEKATSNICTNSGLCVLAFTDPPDSLLGERRPHGGLPR
jgi:glycine dehydrogenase subunit 1